MEKIYLIGQKKSEYEEDFNAAELELKDFGYSVVNPFKVVKNMRPYTCGRVTNSQDHTKACLNELLICDGFYVVNEFESPLVKLERNVAEQCGIAELQIKPLSKKW